MNDEDIVRYANDVRLMFLDGKEIVFPLDLMDKFNINAVDAIEVLDIMKRKGFVEEVK